MHNWWMLCTYNFRNVLFMGRNKYIFNNHLGPYISAYLKSYDESIT